MASKSQWPATELRNLCKGPGEYGANAAALPFDPSLPRYIRITDIDDDGRLIPSSRASIRNDVGARYLLAAGDLLLARTGSVGKSYLYRESDGQCAHAGYLIKFRLDQDHCNPIYVSQWARSDHFWQQVLRSTRQAVQGNINAAEYARFSVPFPPLEVQAAITAILDAADEAIAKTEALIAKLKAIKQGLLHDLLTRGLDDNGELRDPEKHPEQFKETPLGRIPSEWTVSNLGEAVQFAPGFAFPEKFQGQKEGDLPFFKVSDMDSSGNDPILTRANHYVSTELAQRNGWKPLPPNAVVFAKVGAALLLNRRRVLGQYSLIDNNMMIAIAGPEVREAFLYWWLHTVDLAAVAQTTALPSVNQTQLAKIMFVRPPLNEQDRVVNVISNHDGRIRIEEAYLSKLKAIKKGLMQDLLTGRVRVPADKVPAFATG